MLPHAEAMLDHVGAKLGPFGGDVGTMLELTWAKLDYVDLMLIYVGHPEDILRHLRVLRVFVFVFGPSWPHVKAMLGQDVASMGPNWGHVGAP